jgi:NADH:ubiquinone oxidoreductase subunit K
VSLQILSVTVLVFAAMLSLLIRQGLLRMIVGIHLLSLASALPFLVFGERQGQHGNVGEPYALLILISGAVFVTLALALATRLFYQKGRAELKDIMELKN